jgi:CRISPR-associated endoribonuclease Cas6
MINSPHRYMMREPCELMLCNRFLITRTSRQSLSRERSTASGFALNTTKSVRIYHEVFPLKRIDFNVYDAGNAMEAWIDEFKNCFSNTIRIVMTFLTPTQLSAYGSDFACVLPQPERLFPSLLRVWNEIEKATSIEHVSEYRNWIESHVHVSAHRIRTVEVPLGRTRKVVGFLGRVVYSVSDAQSPLAYLTAGLAKFAQLSNVGKNRTAGFGQAFVRIEP